jgi:type II secretory pathway component GspD/PulD (secretin)
MGFVLAMVPHVAQSQGAPPATPSQALPVQAAPSSNQTAQPDNDTKEPKQTTAGNRRRAIKLFLQASKLFEKEKFEEAMRDYRQAAELDPSNTNYTLAAELARSHAVTALIQAAAKDRIMSDEPAERAALQHALELDPKNIQVTEHIHELADDAVHTQPTSLYAQTGDSIGAPIELAPTSGVHSFHLHTDARQTIQQVFRAYGLEATLDESVRSTPIRFDLDDASFEVATRMVELLTDSFYIPLDAHRALVARDTSENRLRFMREEMETIYLPGLTPTDMTDVVNVAKNVFNVQHENEDSSAGTVTLRGSPQTLTAFNATIRDLLAGRNQVLLDVRLIQLAHTNSRNTQTQLPQTVSAFNVYAEEQSILNANQSLVQQIISSGLAAPGDTLAILGILLASGQVSSSLFSNGIALFGGGLTLSGFSPGPITENLSLNSSDSRELEQMQLRLSDGEAGTVKSGTRYPIQTSSFSSLSPSIPNIPGLTSAGASGALSSLLSSLQSSVPNVPQVEYQDLGLTLKATPKVMRNDDVALTIDLKIDALAGTTLNGNPILDNHAYSGVITLRKGEGAVIISELDGQQSRAISGYPGLNEIPGLSGVNGSDVQKSSSTLLIVMTPHVVRGTQSAGHTPMMRVDRSTTVR